MKRLSRPVHSRGDPGGRPIGINLRKDRPEHTTPEVLD
jgi:hypothetical protein